MKRRVVEFIFCIFFIISLSNVNAIVGVTPADYELNFEPNLERKFNFNFIFDEGIKADVYAAGDLAEYVTLNKDSLNGGGSVVAYLKLPSEVEVPGTHRIAIGAKQSIPTKTGMAIVGDVRGVIKINVPYPGKYAEIEFKTTNANAGEPINFTVTVKNLGKENIYAYTSIEISDLEGSYIETLELGGLFVETTKSEIFFKQLDTSNYKPGDYNALVIVNYGGATMARAEKIFRLGTLHVGVFNYTREFEKNKINRMEIEVESFWNDPIQNLHAEVKILDYEISFLTPSTNLGPWEKKMLTGFFDTTAIEKEEFQANITLHYEGKTTSEIVDLRFKKETSYLPSLIGGAAIIIILIVTITIIILLRKKRKSGKEKKT